MGQLFLPVFFSLGRHSRGQRKTWTNSSYTREKNLQKNSEENVCKNLRERNNCDMMITSLQTFTKKTMQSVVASSASPELVHWHDEKPSHLLEEAREDIYAATRDALQELKSFMVGAEHTIADVCTELGIHDISHHIANKNLAWATVTLYSNGNLEIRREGQVHATNFPVQFIA